MVTGSWCEAAADSEGLEHIGITAAAMKQPGQDLRNAGDVLHWSKPGGNIYLYAPLEMLAGAQLCCVRAVKVQLAVSWELALGRDRRLLMASHVTGLNTPPCPSPVPVCLVCSHDNVMWPQ